MNVPLCERALGLVAGYVATKISDRAGVAMEDAMPAPQHAKEQRASPGPSAQIAASKMAGLAGKQLDQHERSMGGKIVHYRLGAIWGLSVDVLRRYTRLHSATAALGTGLSLSVVVGEGFQPGTGFQRAVQALSILCARLGLRCALRSLASPHSGCRKTSSKRKTAMKLKTRLKAMRRMPMFPIMPIVPIAVISTVIGLTLSNHRRLKRLERRLGG